MLQHTQASCCKKHQLKDFDRSASDWIRPDVMFHGNQKYFFIGCFVRAELFPILLVNEKIRTFVELHEYNLIIRESALGAHVKKLDEMFH